MMFLFCTWLCPQYLKRSWLILVGQHSMVNNRWMTISQFIREQDHGQNITLWNLIIVLAGLVSYLKFETHKITIVLAGLVSYLKFETNIPMRMNVTWSEDTYDMHISQRFKYQTIFCFYIYIIFIYLNIYYLTKFIQNMFLNQTF